MGVSPRIAKFQWDEANLAHIACHEMTRLDVEEAFLDPFALLEGNVSRKGEVRFRMLGQIADGRVISIVFVIRTGEIRAVTAHPVKGRRLLRYMAGRLR